MPVRIVKDNPDEMVVNDNFNFENPQDQGNQGGGGGGIDLSFLNNLLGGGGGNQGGSGGINIMDLLGGGGNRGDGGGGILDILGGGGQSNQSSGGSGLLGGLINSFLGGGGGSQVNRGGGNNGLLSVLGGMAVNACINYAINSFTNKGGGGSFSKGAPTKEDVDGLLNERLASAEMCVSLWSYSVYADDQLQNQEKQALESLVNDTVHQLFPSSIADQNEVRQILMDKVNNPLDYDEVVKAASQDYNFAGQLYQQACLLIAADQALGGAEDNYLHDLADDLGLDANDATTIRQKFGMN